jgi:hypothetical protein
MLDTFLVIANKEYERTTTSNYVYSEIISNYWKLILTSVRNN